MSVELTIAKEVEKLVLDSGYSIAEGIQKIIGHYSKCSKNSSQDRASNGNLLNNIIHKDEDIDNEGRIFDIVTGEIRRDLIWAKNNLL